MSFFFWLVLWLGICVEIELDKITFLSPPQPLPYFFPYPQFFLLTQVTVIRNQRAPKAGFGTV